MRTPRLHLSAALAILLGFLNSLGGAEPTLLAGSDYILENALYRVQIDRLHGRLLRLLDRQGQIDLASPLELAENFRIFVPLPEDGRNCVYGKDQTLSRADVSSDTLVLYWEGPMRDQRGVTQKLSAKMRVELKAERVEFRFSLVNGTGVKIQEVWYPAIGGLLGFGPSNVCASSVLNPPPHTSKRFSRPFGQHLASYPSQNMGFVEVDNPALKRGMYLGAHDLISRFKNFCFLEQGNGDKSNVAAWLIHYPFTQPGASFEGSPLVAQFHQGDWLAGGREIYRPWFIKTFGLMKPEQDWIRQNSFFQMIMIMLPEGNINYRINQIPELARDGLKYGLKSLQIAGWQFGGHDNGYPYYEPDPRLGTWRDLKRAIHQCHELGVKIYFFANIHVNNLDTAWYENELKDYDFETLKGQASWVAGWGMGTLASRMGLTTPMMAFADTSFPRLADAQLNYFKKLATSGADGIHIDKGFPQPLNFNPRVVLSPDQSPWEGTTRMVDRISRECRALHPDFRISFETAWDRMLSYGASTWWAGNMSVARRIFPELVETVGLYQPYDYIGVNDAVRNGHAVMVAPYHFNRSMDYEPWRRLAGYIREVKRVRDELTDYVFCGEQLSAREVPFGDKATSSGIEHALYRNPKNDKRACILTNRGSAPASVELVNLGAGRTQHLQLFRPGKEIQALQLPAQVTVDSERIVFVVEN